MNYFLGLVVAFVAGGIVAFFVLKNNPKFLNIEKLSKEQLQALLKKVEEQLKK